MTDHNGYRVLIAAESRINWRKLKRGFGVTGIESRRRSKATPRRLWLRTSPI
jgi:hypothetical protein